METLFSTGEVHPRDRFEYWHDVACQQIVKHESQPECRLTFQASIQTGALSDLGLVLFENSPMEVVRASRHIAHAAGDELFICRQLFGRLALEQNGREVVLEGGHITLLDPLLPYVGRFSAGSNLLVLKVPRHALVARLGNLWDMVIRSIKPSGPLGSLASSYVAMLPSLSGRIDRAAEEIIKNQVLDLMAISLTEAIGTHSPTVSSTRSLALMNVHTAIETRLSDPELDADAVAAAARISVRYANKVLAREGTSVVRLIQAKRLARCRKALEDPLQADRTLSEIAYAWGFSDMTHFSRRFKAAYGVLPSDYRRR
jgi:AraC family transcriptional regulator, positive regulator of tynA and feaB